MKRRKKKPAPDGYAYRFHGSYSSKAKAETKAKQRDGFLISRVPRGANKRRSVVGQFEERHTLGAKARWHCWT